MLVWLSVALYTLPSCSSTCTSAGPLKCSSTGTFPFTISFLICSGDFGWSLAFYFFPKDFFGFTGEGSGELDEGVLGRDFSFLRLFFFSSFGEGLASSTFSTFRFLLGLSYSFVAFLALSLLASFSPSLELMDCLTHLPLLGLTSFDFSGAFLLGFFIGSSTSYYSESLRLL